MPATLPGDLDPVSREQLEEHARACARSARVARSTCASSLHAATDARWTNSWGVTPTRRAERLQRRDQLADRRPRTRSDSPVIDERLLSVLTTSTFVRSPTCSAEAGGPPSNHSSLYASSSASRKPCVARELGGPLEEGERRHRARRVVRVVEPQDRRARPRRGVDGARGRAGTRRLRAAADAAPARRR